MNFSVTKPVPAVAMYGGEASAPLAVRRQFGTSFQMCQLVLKDLGLLSIQQKKDAEIEARFHASLKEPPSGPNGF